MSKFYKVGNIFFVFFLSLIVIFVNAHFSSAAAQTSRTYKFINGNWFNGKSFEKRVFYAVNDTLTGKAPKIIDETIDLKNGFVVPPFGDSHCHHFDSVYNVDQQIGMYLKEGVFYAKVQTNGRKGALQIADKVNKPISVDVSYAHGALTHTNGHGVEVYEGLALYRKTGAFTPEEEKKVRASRLRENDFYYIIDTAEDLEKKWQIILDGKPDFLKIYLLTSEEYEAKNKNLDTIRVGSIGLDPKIVPLIVQKAHASGLKISAHVDTITDYRLALKSGVDFMAHLPGYYIAENDDPQRYLLTIADVKETVKRKVGVNVDSIAQDTFNPQSQYYDAKIKERTDIVRKHNLELLKKFKAGITFGSDHYGKTPVDDVLYLQKTGIFSNLELLKIWATDTPQSIFPGRRIGFLKEGYEASFLVLNGNPLMDFNNIRNINLRFKQGRRL